MADVQLLVEQIRRQEGSMVVAPAGLPPVAHGLSMPTDLLSFYEACGGVRFGSVAFEIVQPSRFLPVNDVVLGEQFPDDASAGWYLVGESDTSGTAERISIDLRPGYGGRCYDSFWDRHGVAGSMSIVADSFTSFLARLMTDGLYWNDPGFASEGDAYDL